MLAEAIIGHFVGDYVAQNDWMAQGKKKPGFRGQLACLVHCSLWTAAVLVCSWAFSVPLMLWLFGTHYAIDRTQFIRWWMGKVGQAGFRDGLAPWSSIAVDNTFHLITLLIGFRLFV